ncbi:MAG TPA: endonuclease/exonuclease/phosphatase family protein [Phycisphaerales bacterium]|nr:endonuclease/exonuclease/phosphatase family protein [Phycisphaerales bacterium]
MPRGPIGRAVTVLAWLAGASALLSSVLWMFAGWSWRIDLAANLGAQMLAGCGFIACVQGLLRRWWPLVLTGTACLLHMVPLLSHRAAIWPRGIEQARGSDPRVVRLMHYNDSSLSDKASVYALMDRENADIVSILSPPVHMQFDVIYDHGLEDKYPGKLTRPWAPSPDGVTTEVTPGFVVSRWPLTRVDCSFVGPVSNRFIAAIVERPAGRFGLIAVHPRSPRWRERWEEGNEVAEALVMVALDLRGQGLPVVVLTDMNATPTGWRSRHVCAEANLLRAKPLLVCDGTYPDVVPWNLRTREKTSIPARWPLSIAIDDALISPEIDVTGWRVGGFPASTGLRSEHRPVTIELRIPAPAASVSNQKSR